MLIVDGGGADSCNDLICLCAWRWKDQSSPESGAPSFSVNRVNYLFNEICKVVNFSTSLLLSPTSATSPPSACFFYCVSFAPFFLLLFAIFIFATVFFLTFSHVLGFDSTPLVTDDVVGSGGIRQFWKSGCFWESLWDFL